MKQIASKQIASMVFATALAASSSAVHAQENADSGKPWLPTLITDTPQEGFALAVLLARKGVGTTQPDKEVLKDLRATYAHDPDSLTAASHVIAIHFQTVAAANDYWRME